MKNRPEHRAEHEHRRLPVDADIEVDEVPSGPPRPLHLRPSALLLVAAGGALGTAVREALSLTFPSPGGVPYVIAAINVVGALVLGALLEGLSRQGADVGRRRAVRLFVGTGVLGGFTTYSALAADTVILGIDRPWVAVLYAAGSLVVGLLAAVAGTAAFRALRPTAPGRIR